MKLIKTLDTIGRYTATITLSFGSVVFIWTLCFPKFQLAFKFIETFIYYGFFWNMIVLIFLIAAAITFSKYRNHLFKTTGILLLNIPVAIIYLIIAFIVF